MTSGHRDIWTRNCAGS